MNLSQSPGAHIAWVLFLSAAKHVLIPTTIAIGMLPTSHPFPKPGDTKLETQNFRLHPKCSPTILSSETQHFRLHSTGYNMDGL